MMVRKLAAMAAFALGTAISAGAAHADTYVLNASDAFGPGNYGQVTVTGTSTDLHFEVQLFDSNHTISAGHFAIAGELGGSITGLVLPSSEKPGGVADFTLSTDTSSGLTNDPFKGFDFALTCTACGNGASSPYTNQDWTFDITGTGLSVLAALTPYTPKGGGSSETVYFAADIYNGVTTGTVGGGPSTTTTGGGGGVPEPATWGLMILGVFGAGAAMRQHRRQAHLKA